jgi:hypothetical protein
VDDLFWQLLNPKKSKMTAIKKVFYIKNCHFGTIIFFFAAGIFLDKFVGI